MMRVWGCRCPHSSLGVLGISSEPLLSPSLRDSLAPGVPPAPPPSIGLARPAPPAGRPGTRVPVQCIPPGRLPSVRPPLPAASVQPRLTWTPASRLLRLPPPPQPSPPLQQPQPRRERGKEGGGGSPLRSACPLLSGPLPYALLPHAAAPAPSRPAQGSHACQARVTQATRGGTTRASSLLLSTRTSWGYPLPKPRAPPANGHRGPGRGRVLDETERGLREAGPGRQAGPGGVTPTSGKKGREMRKNLGRL